jgi:hypothetical protein
MKDKGIDPAPPNAEGDMTGSILDNPDLLLQ